MGSVCSDKLENGNLTDWRNVNVGESAEFITETESTVLPMILSNDALEIVFVVVDDDDDDDDGEVWGGGHVECSDSEW